MKRGKQANATTDRRSYTIYTTVDPDPYVEDFWARHKPYKAMRAAQKWNRRVLYCFEYRMYRTWKHNRMTKWKQTKTNSDENKN